jgi:hypothetical protein
MMKSVRMMLLAIGLAFGASDFVSAATHNFNVTDVPGRWFDAGKSIAGTRSLHIAAPGDTIHFNQVVESLHTVTSLVWPTAAAVGERIDQAEANRDNHDIILNTPGLYVFLCKLHPYMLGAVLVDDSGTAGVDIGDSLTLLVSTDVTAANLSFPSNSNLGLRLLRAFFVVTNPSNWKDYTRVGSTYLPNYPSVDVRVHDGAAAAVVNLKTTLQTVFPGEVIPSPQKPVTAAGAPIRGVGEVWLDTQYEVSWEKGPAYPGTMTVVTAGGATPATNWKVRRKIALPSRLMNNGHNMWASHNQNQIYQTEWHGESLFVIDRVTGKLLREIELGHDPAHVMTRVDTGQVHVTLNGEDYVAELNKVPAPEYLQINRLIPMREVDGNGLPIGNPTQPHAHWMGHDGKSMATPNANTGDSTLYAFHPTNPNAGTITSKEATGALPIASSMNPRGTKYYVSNYLGHSISVMCGPNAAVPPIATCQANGPGTKITDINLLQNYNPITGVLTGNGAVGALPIQTPVSPDGRFILTGNTLTGTITIIDAQNDTLVGMLPCDPGCHGVNFGAKKGGGYLAYVTSKFANRLLVVDYDPNNDGNVADARIAGWVVLADGVAPTDAWNIDNLGQGGQGVLPVPNVYNGWVQKLPAAWRLQLTPAQRNPAP